MRRFRVIVAMVMLVLTMPLTRACAVISRAAVAQSDCCKKKADSCCEGSAKFCCAAQSPTDLSLVPSQNVSSLLLPPLPVPVVYADRIDSLNAQCAAPRLPAEYSPPGLTMVEKTILRI
jgi:hypothetical protein